MKKEGWIHQVSFLSRHDLLWDEEYDHGIDHHVTLLDRDTKERSSDLIHWGEWEREKEIVERETDERKYRVREWGKKE